METPKVLYSVNTLLAYNINQNFYNQLHYVWCCPYFNWKAASQYDFRIPRSSTPSEIYADLLKEVRSNDRHSFKVKENRIGLLKGVVEKHKQGVISDEQKGFIETMISEASGIDFTPLIYVIPFQKAKKLLENVPVRERASVLSNELRIRELPRHYFDIMDFDSI